MNDPLNVTCLVLQMRANTAYDEGNFEKAARLTREAADWVRSDQAKADLLERAALQEKGAA